MSAEARKWRVGVTGLSSAGLFHLERLSLSEEIHLVAANDDAPQRRLMATGRGFPVLAPSNAANEFSDVDAMIFADDISFDVASATLRGGCHVVIHRPWLLSSEQLRNLHAVAELSPVTATTACLRRWSADFTAASAAIQTGRLGIIRTAHLMSYELGLSTDESFSGALREFGYHWLDQLLIMVKSKPCSVYARRLDGHDQSATSGFVAMIQFANGCTAQIDANPQSRLGYRTGWMLEGSLGSYRHERLYTVAPDGEIVDEPLKRPTLSSDPFITELVSSWSGRPTTLPKLAGAARIVRLIESIEESQATESIVRL